MHLERERERDEERGIQAAKMEENRRTRDFNKRTKPRKERRVNGRSDLWEPFRDGLKALPRLRENAARIHRDEEGTN